MTRTVRDTARVVPVAGDGTCLLLLERDPARPDEHRWGTVGGAIEPGESERVAAVRELYEETGIAVAPEALIGPVDEVVSDFSWNGADYRGRATVFAVALDRATPISFDHLAPLEIGNLLEARWLSPAEVTGDGRVVWPDLPEMMTHAIAAVRGQQ